MNKLDNLHEKVCKEAKAEVIKSFGKYKVMKDGKVLGVYVAKYEAEDHVRALND